MTNRSEDKERKEKNWRTIGRNIEMNKEKKNWRGKPT